MGRKCGRAKRYRPDSDYDPKEMRAGIKVELEHTCDRAEAREIAKDHLDEHPRYYTALTKMEARLKRGLASNPRAVGSAAAVTLTETDQGGMAAFLEINGEAVEDAYAELRVMSPASARRMFREEYLADPGVIREHDGRIGVLTGIEIPKDMRGSGYGTMILRRLWEWAAQHKLRAIYLLADNERVISLYERLGCEAGGTALGGTSMRCVVGRGAKRAGSGTRGNPVPVAQAVELEAMALAKAAYEGDVGPDAPDRERLTAARRHIAAGKAYAAARDACLDAGDDYGAAFMQERSQWHARTAQMEAGGGYLSVSQLHHEGAPTYFDLDRREPTPRYWAWKGRGER